MDNKKTDPPGWNDPPMLNYNASNPPPKSRITNKRVAFPLFGSNSNTASTATMPGAMPPASSAVPPSLNAPPIPQEIKLSNEELLKSVKDNFEIILRGKDCHINKNNIELLLKMWREDKFNEQCQNYIHLFSKYLVEGNKVDAQQIKEKLMSEFQDTCKAWLDGFEEVIL